MSPSIGGSNIPNLPTRLVLVGYMGAGKTVIGKRLARALAYGFVDTDTWVETEHAMTVSQLFEGHGEPFFRQAEQKAFSVLMGQSSRVIATGGGDPDGSPVLGVGPGSRMGHLPPGGP